MNGYENLGARLKWMGGVRQESRMSEDKLRTLKKALIYSYQACTMVLADNREFRCLMNPNKNSVDYDNKIVSVPFKDICLNEPKKTGIRTADEQEIGLKPGDVFTWKETDTKWIVYLRHLEEDAYFRAQVRKCEGVCELYELDGANSYDVYIRGNTATTIDYSTRPMAWNKLNYDLLMYITKNEETENYIKRFNKVKINGSVYEIQTKDLFAGDGIIEVCLKETYSNTIEDAVKEEEAEKPAPPITPFTVPEHVKPYDRIVVKLLAESSVEDYQWKLSNKKASLVSVTATAATIDIISSRSGEVELTYSSKSDAIDPISTTIVIESI